MVKFDRPCSESELDTILDCAYQLATRHEYDAAVELCNWLINDRTTEIAGLRERAAVRSHMGDKAGAIADLHTVIAAQPDEPADLHTLGILLLASGATAEAIKQFEAALTAGVEADNHYYSNSSRLFLAEAKLRNGDFASAADSAALLPVAYGTWIDGRGMRRREEILADAQYALQRMS